MNRSIALAIALSSAAAGTAFADDITVDPHPFVSTATRAQVNEDLRQFRQSRVNPWADDYNHVPLARSSLTRDEVRTEFMKSRNAVAAFSSEDSGSSYLARAKVAPPRVSTDLAHAE